MFLKNKLTATKSRKGVALFLMILSLLQMSGDIFNVPALKAIGASFGASPAPKVFSSIDGLETFSSEFYLTWQDKQGIWQKQKLTPELAKKFKGPYNRRNVYGAILSYGPVFSKNAILKPAYEAILSYAASEKGSFFKELGIDRDNIGSNLFIEVVPKNETSALNLIKEIRIHEK